MLKTKTQKIFRFLATLGVFVAILGMVTGAYAANSWDDANGVLVIEDEMTDSLANTIAAMNQKPTLLSDIKSLTIAETATNGPHQLTNDDLIYIWGNQMTNLVSLNLGGATVAPGVGIPGIWFYQHQKLASVSLPKGIEMIESGAFEGCTSLTEVNLSGLTALTTIDSSAFRDCAKLTNLDLSDLTSLTTIGAQAFDGCTSLTEVDLSGLTSLTTIGSTAFGGCTGLTALNLSGLTKLTAIGADAFGGCTDLTTVTLPASVAEIALWVFEGSGLTTAILLGDAPTLNGGDPFPYATTFYVLPNATGYDEGDWQGYYEAGRINYLIPATSLTKGTGPTSIEVGESDTFTVTVEPSYATVSWSSANTNVATIAVDEDDPTAATATGVAAGTTTITATAFKVDGTPISVDFALAVTGVPVDPDDPDDPDPTKPRATSSGGCSASGGLGLGLTTLSAAFALTKGRKRISR